MADRPQQTIWKMRGVLAVGGVLLAAFILRALTGFGGPSAQRFFATWVSDGVMLIAISLCFWRAVAEPRDRVIWGLVGLGLTAWGLGNAYFSHSLASGASLPNPSPADLGYLIAYLLVYVAIVAVRRRNLRRAEAALLLDGMIGAAACVTVGAALVLEPVLDASSADSVAGGLTDIAYPIGDLTLLGMLVITMTSVDWRGARGLILLVSGLAVFALSDSLYLIESASGGYEVGGLLDAGWLAAMMLVALGATSVPLGWEPAADWSPPLQRAIVPTVAGFAALVVLALEPFLDVPPAALALAIVTLALVLVRLAISLRETGRLMNEREREAKRDPVTGLPNRRELFSNLRRLGAEATEEDPILLVLFDLDGFKTYNDTFGHQAGDRLLAQAGESLAEAVGGRGRAYRIGGDEFCALLRIDRRPAEEIGGDLARAMSRRGEGFSITASFGCAVAPLDGRDTTVLMRRADDEMYGRKGRRRPGTERQLQDALTAVLRARDPEMERHAAGVTKLSAALGRYLGLAAADQRALVHAAALHEIGRVAATKDATSHTVTGESILTAAPSLGYAAQIVRSVEERWDGSGRPDGLRGDSIPLPARVIAVCDAFTAMTSDRRAGRAKGFEEAIAELRRCAGSQFDPELVRALVEVLRHPVEHPARESSAPPPDPAPLDSRAITGRRPVEAALAYQAEHDLLTGLLNRRRFSEELERMLRFATRYRHHGAVLLIDLQDLKLVNDLHGRAAGDGALKKVSEVILSRTRATDVVGRLGSDEFAIALHNVSDREVLRVAEDLRDRIAVAEIDPPVQASIGIGLFTGDPELVADDLLTAADVALFEAREAGRGKVRLNRGHEGAGLGWVQRIRSAVDKERFVLYGQPIVEVASGRAAYRELLLRMLSDDGDVIPPGAFIPTAERFGLMGDIDRWVTRKGLRLAGEGLPVSINLSAHSIGDSRILEAVQEAARRGLAPDRVLFEITETAAMANLDEARVYIEKLNGLGCEVALDDFGTGFGSFTYLKQLPTRFLKVDIEFVRDLASNVTDQKVVKSITEVGHSLDKLIVAEGVEDGAPMPVLRAYGVDYAQGRYLGEPERITTMASVV